MKITSVFVAVLCLTIHFGSAAEKEEKKANRSSSKPAPFQDYWAARSWDRDGASFWNAKEESRVEKADPQEAGK